jgi:two-component system, NtrC family, nitrogen regulation sensor histidine kinase NtrY
MPTTLRDVQRPTLPPRSAAAALPPPSRPAPPERRRFRDNPRLILLGILILLIALVAMVTLADRAPELNPNFLTEVLLYALSAADLTMLIALGFVLARNIIKLAVERRRGLPFSRFRAKLVGAMLGLTIIPALLVLLVGSELIRSATQKWVSQPVEAVLGSAKQIAGEYYKEREGVVVRHAADLARAIPLGALRAGDSATLRRVIEAEVTHGRIPRVEIYALVPGAEPIPLVAAQSPTVPRDDVRALTDRFAARVAAGSTSVTHEKLDSGGEVVQAGSVVTDPATRQPLGVVIASDYLTGELADEFQRIIAAYENHTRLGVLTRPLQGIYLSLFLMMTLMILVSATWMGLYLAKRITRPVHMLAAGAREIGAGHLDHRIEPETRDEFGSLIEAFNSMAGELATSQRKLERSRLDLEQKNLQLDERRRYIETVLERIATGVVSIGADGGVETINGAALRLLDVDRTVVGTHAEDIFEREDLRPLGTVLRQTRSAAGLPAGQEITLVREGRELHLAAAATPLHGEDGSPEGAVLVFDDVTPLIRTQRVAAWRDVARRLAHEIKNPLTPIQLCAERMRRHFGSVPPPARDIVVECTSTIVGEVESLKALVDEFAQFARMPAPKAVPTDLHRLVLDALALYNGLFRNIRIEHRFDESLPPVRLDAEQVRRVLINLVDNAVEALGGASAAEREAGETPTIVVETQHDRGNAVARVVVTDNGSGIPPADRDKLFMPYYSTKLRGSGLGLAIVRRIIVEHGGSIEVLDNEPHGSRFVIELPL